MRKPKDYDAELRTLAERSRELRARKLFQLGELVTSCGADALPIEVLAGALLEATKSEDASRLEAWRTSGVGFFHRARGSSSRAGPGAGRGAEGSRPATTPGSEPGAS